MHKELLAVLASGVLLIEGACSSRPPTPTPVRAIVPTSTEPIQPNSCTGEYVQFEETAEYYASIHLCETKTGIVPSKGKYHLEIKPTYLTRITEFRDGFEFNQYDFRVLSDFQISPSQVNVVSRVGQISEPAPQDRNDSIILNVTLANGHRFDLSWNNWQFQRGLWNGKILFDKTPAVPVPQNQG